MPMTSTTSLVLDTTGSQRVIAVSSDSAVITELMASSSGMPAARPFPRARGGGLAVLTRRSGSASGEDEPLDGFGEALFLVRGRDPPSRALHIEARVAHRDAQAGVGEHQHVVWHVADRGDGLRRDPVLRGQVAGDRALVGVRMGDIEVVG